ncbi:MAG: hypothetical protein WC549_02470 [Actinomycetota bacterium]
MQKQRDYLDNDMKIEEYSKYLQKQDILDDVIEKRIKIIEDFINYLKDSDSKEIKSAVVKEEVEKFARKLIVEKRNTPENFSFLCDYADWPGNRKFYVAFIELMDCYNALEVLADKIEKKYGQDICNRIFTEPLPPLGANEKERCAYTRMITEQMSQQLTTEDIRNIWFQVQHGIPASDWFNGDIADKNKYRQYGDIDEFLEFKRQERNTLLKKLRNENQLWYTLEINDEVLEFITSNPEMESGRREGNRFYITKVPYNPIRYLHETDKRMKRYYACHCPLVREAILKDQPISPDICYCSLGHASHYLAGLNQELKGEVLESAIRGDVRCRFVFYLPDKNNNME